MTRHSQGAVLLALFLGACAGEPEEPDPTPAPPEPTPAPDPQPHVHRCAAAGRVEGGATADLGGYRSTLCLGAQDLTGASTSDTLFIAYPGPIRSLEP